MPLNCGNVHSTVEATMGQNTEQVHNKIEPVYNVTCIRVKYTAFITQIFLSQEQTVKSNEKIRFCLTTDSI